MAHFDDLAATPGGERRSYLVPIPLAILVVVSLSVWWFFYPHQPRPAVMTFESAGYACRFQYPGVLTAGPNFVKTDSGSILTIERHSLFMAKKDWVAGLPEVLFPQLMIQIRENYVDVDEISRKPLTGGGRTGVEIRRLGSHGRSKTRTTITAVIFANDAWVYVLRAYSPEKLDGEEYPLFSRAWQTWEFLREEGTGGEPGGAAAGA